jgi:hypothetical protein
VGSISPSQFSSSISLYFSDRFLLLLDPLPSSFLLLSCSLSRFFVLLFLGQYRQNIMHLLDAAPIGPCHEIVFICSEIHFDLEPTVNLAIIANVHERYLSSPSPPSYVSSEQLYVTSDFQLSQKSAIERGGRRSISISAHLSLSLSLSSLFTRLLPFQM